MRGHVASLLEVGTGFHPELTGRENIYLNGMLLGMSSKQVSQVFDAICEFASVGDYINVPIKRYSSGMQLRLAFSVAAHLRADTMIVDEVLAVGDAEFQRKCLGAMRDVSRSGRTTLFVSHNMSAIEALCSRVVWLDKGEIRAEGATDRIVRDYLRAGVSTADAHARRILVTDSSRARQLGGARVRSIEVKRESPEEAHPWRVRFGEPVSLAIEFELLRALVEPVLGVGIRNERGEDVLTSHTSDLRTDIRLTGRTGVATVRLNAPWLRPGAYSIEVAIMSATQLVDHVEDVATLVVEEQSAAGAPALTIKKGAVVPLWEWTVSPLAES
jgi:ABC-type multidrug transport system ATPase subunit